MIAELRLLLREVSEDEYRAHVERGIPLPIARPGWSHRFGQVVRIAAITVGAVTGVVAVSAAIVVLFAMTDRLPR